MKGKRSVFFLLMSWPHGMRATFHVFLWLQLERGGNWDTVALKGEKPMCVSTCVSAAEIVLGLGVVRLMDLGFVHGSFMISMKIS